MSAEAAIDGGVAEPPTSAVENKENSQVVMDDLLVGGHNATAGRSGGGNAPPQDDGDQQREVSAMHACTDNKPEKIVSPPVEIKLFVGRVPRTYEEEDLRPVFADFGTVGDVIIIKDRETQAHKGCAFVRMNSITQADNAVRILSNNRILDQALGPLQVKYAAGEAERLSLTPENAQPGTDQAKLFVGSLPKTAEEDDIRVVFQRYGTIDEVFVMRDEAKASKGCAFVKFAYKADAFNAIANLNGKYTMPGSNRAMEVRFAEGKKNSQNSAVRLQQETSHNYWQEYYHENRPYYYHTLTRVTQWERPPELDQNVYNVSPNAAGAQTHGPPGANVFIFHIPNEWTENDLMQHFSPFGHIVSARIATDKGTGRNRGFGFVSFNDVAASVAAVNSLNGFNVSGKRLKVQIKKGEEHFVQQQQPWDTSALQSLQASNVHSGGQGTYQHPSLGVLGAFGSVTTSQPMVHASQMHGGHVQATGGVQPNTPFYPFYSNQATAVQ